MSDSERSGDYSVHLRYISPELSDIYVDEEKKITDESAAESILVLEPYMFEPYETENENTCLTVNVIQSRKLKGRLVGHRTSKYGMVMPLVIESWCCREIEEVHCETVRTQQDVLFIVETNSFRIQIVAWMQMFSVAQTMHTSTNMAGMHSNMNVCGVSDPWPPTFSSLGIDAVEACVPSPLYKLLAGVLVPMTSYTISFALSGPPCDDVRCGQQDMSADPTIPNKMSDSERSGDYSVHLRYISPELSDIYVDEEKKITDESAAESILVLEPYMFEPYETENENTCLTVNVIQSRKLKGRLVGHRTSKYGMVMPLVIESWCCREIEEVHCETVRTQQDVLFIVETNSFRIQIVAWMQMFSVAQTMHTSTNMAGMHSNMNVCGVSDPWPPTFSSLGIDAVEACVPSPLYKLLAGVLVPMTS
ncbi:hypothetical protein GQR58_002714 [Nymphon striatum]|nr:hypothetical protein GQR58_002714 [Nymphon striatum]